MRRSLLLLLTAQAVGGSAPTGEPLPTLILGGVTMVPSHAVGELLAIEMAADATDRTWSGRVRAGPAGSSFRLVAGSARAEVGGRSTPLPRPCLAADGELYVPLRFLADLAVATVRWLPARRVVEVARAGETRELTVAPALFALVDPRSGLLVGGSNGVAWLSADTCQAQLAGGERYRLAGLTEPLGQATGAVPRLEAPGEYPYVELSPEPPGAATVASCAPWSLLARGVATSALTQQVYLDATRALLRQRGLPEAVPNLSQVVRCDLEGDGIDEVILAAVVAREGYPQPNIEANDYSFVALRRVIDGQVRTTLLEGEFHRRSAEFAAPNRFDIAAVVDLNGDARLEIVVSTRYYEGMGMAVHELRNGRLVRALENGMGA